MFLGKAPSWYKSLIAVALLANPLAYAGIAACVSPAAASCVVGWLMMGEFIATLAMALACYPLLPGGLIALEAILLGLCPVDALYAEAHRNFPVILLLVFLVAGVGFLKEWLSAVFTRVLFCTRSKIALSAMFCAMGAVLSAFLDALTVIAVLITVCRGFHDVYHDWRSRSRDRDEAELDSFRAFLRSLVMHAAIGTALGGVATMIGEPQNLLIAHVVAERLPARAEHWGFMGFLLRMSVVTVPTLAAGLAVTVVCERFRIFGYGARMPDTVREALSKQERERSAARTPIERGRLWVQGACALLLVAGLAFHWAEVGILGLFLIVVATSFTGVSDEHRIGLAFTESLPFVALLVVFFAIVVMIDVQGLFRPMIAAALAHGERGQLTGFFWGTAVLSTISDNVFVATVFINEAAVAHASGRVSDAQFERLAIAINAGTNIPSVATPNGQAALLFLLTSSLSPLLRLGYARMCVMALPYAIVTTVVAFACVFLFV